MLNDMPAELEACFHQLAKLVDYGAEYLHCCCPVLDGMLLLGGAEFVRRQADSIFAYFEQGAMQASARDSAPLVASLELFQYSFPDLSVDILSGLLSQLILLVSPPRSFAVEQMTRIRYCSVLARALVQTPDAMVAVATQAAPHFLAQVWGAREEAGRDAESALRRPELADGSAACIAAQDVQDSGSVSELIGGSVLAYVADQWLEYFDAAGYGSNSTLRRKLWALALFRLVGIGLGRVLGRLEEVANVGLDVLMEVREASEGGMRADRFFPGRRTAGSRTGRERVGCGGDESEPGDRRRQAADGADVVCRLSIGQEVMDAMQSAAARTPASIMESSLAAVPSEVLTQLQEEAQAASAGGL